MQKIIVDTNVIVSALISNNLPSKIINDIILTGNVHLCMSEPVYEEYIDVLNRPKFAKFPEFKRRAEIVLSKISEVGIYYTPKVKVDIISDTSDNMFLELALESSADFLITGNTNDFNLREFEYTKIVTPREYWDLYADI